jgi:hypothetical protein
MLENELIEGCDQQEHEDAPVEPVLEPSPAGEASVFLDRQRLDLSEAAAVEVAGGSVMNRVGSPTRPETL